MDEVTGSNCGALRTIQDNRGNIDANNKTKNHQPFNVVHWLIENYLPFNGKAVEVKQLQSNYEEVVPDKENCLTNPEIGRLIKKVFPGIKRDRVRNGNGGKINIYRNLCLAKDCLIATFSWNELKEFQPRFGISFSKARENYCEFINGQSDETCDGHPVIKTVRVFENWDIKVYVRGQEVPCGVIGMNKIEPSLQSFNNMLYLVSVLQCCRGFAIPSESLKRQAKDKSGRSIGVTHIWSTEDEEGIAYHRSVDCSFLLPLTTRSDSCSSCLRVKSNSGKYFLNDRDENSTPIAKRKREDYMTKEELTEKLRMEKKARKSAERRESHLREKITLEMMEFDEEQSQDFSEIFLTVPEDKVSEDMKMFWDEQRKALKSKGKSGCRWHPKVIRLCLSIWNRSPAAYEELKGSGMMKLPSGRLLQYYKNSVQQKPGLNEDVLKWMANEAEKLNLDSFGKSGGIILDEMSIQEDLEMKMVNGKMKLIGLVDLGHEHDGMISACKEKGNKAEDDVRLATHALQFVFLGNSGFRFPIAHWPTLEIDPGTLYIKFWTCVRWLLLAGFKVHYCCCDGGTANRSFIKLHFQGKDPVQERFTTLNPYTREPLVFIMDPFHNFKKLRNNIEKSSVDTGKRLLQKSGNTIEWCSFKSAYKWDQDKHTLKVHENLTSEHFNLGYASRMRNHLATNVLNKKMLYLMQAYKQSFPQESSPHVAKEFNFLIELLEHTSSVIEIFTDMMPIVSEHDPRLSALSSFQQWLGEWKMTEREPTSKAADLEKRLLSQKLQFDLDSMVFGFKRSGLYPLPW